MIKIGNLLPFDNSKQTINITINDCPDDENYFLYPEDQNLKIDSW